MSRLMDGVKKQKKFNGLWAIPAAAVLSYILTYFFPFFEVSDIWLNELQISYFNPDVENSEEIVILTIQEDDLAMFPYRSPIDREYLSGIIDTLQTRNVKSLFIDILFDQPTEPEKDVALKKSILNFDKPLVISFGLEDVGLTPSQVKWQDEFVNPEFRGLPNLVTSRFDETARWVFPGQEVPGRGYMKSVPSLLAHKIGIEDVLTEEVLIRWRGNINNKGVPFNVFAVKTLKLLPKSWLENKVVFLGVELPMDDRYRTPFSSVLKGEGRLPGLFILAHIYSQIIEDNKYYQPWVEKLVNMIVVLLCATVAVLPIFFLQGSVIRRIMAFLAIVSFIFLFVFLVFQQLAIYISFSTTVLSFSLSILFFELWRLHQEEKQKNIVHNMFGLFVDKEYVDLLLIDPEKITLDGDRKHMSYIFTDIADFTTFSEKNDPVLVSKTLNEYLSICSDVIFKHKGTIIDYIGDAIFVVFNAPIDQEAYLKKVVECAQELGVCTEEFRHRSNNAAIDFGLTRIGVHAGEAIIGNMGSKDRMKFSAIGDTINTAARVEGLNKYLGTQVLVTAELDSVDYVKRPVGRFILKGRANELAIYEPLHPGHPALTYLNDYNQAYTLMDQGDEGALEAFRELERRHGKDCVVSFHIDRQEKGARDAIVKMADK